MKAEIEVNGPRCARILLDGQDVAKGARGFTFQSEVGQLPVLTLDLMVLDVSRLDATDVQVIVPEATVKLLRTLGWTPPE